MPLFPASDPLFLSAAVYVLSVALYLIYRRYAKLSVIKYPRGPRGDPVLGNWRGIPGNHAYLYYAKLTKLYGDVVQLTALNTRIIILGNYDTVNALFGKRGTIYAGRPRFPVTDLIIGDDVPPMSTYGPRWKEERRLYHAYLSKETVVDRYGPNIEANVQRWIWRSTQLEKTTSDEFDKTVIKIFMRTIYGIDVEADDDPFIRNTLGVVELASPTTVPGRDLANIFPILLRLPTWLTRLPYKAQSVGSRAKITRMVKDPFVRAATVTDHASMHPSFTLDMLTGSTTLTQKQIMMNSGSTLLAGLDTTGATVEHFLRAMLCYPEVQKKAQAEIDHIIGGDRLPTFEDHDKLPYLQAVFRETLRWHPAVAAGLAHEALQDDVYNDWTIHKGTIVLANNWAISRDERQYADPEVFRPERFLGENPELDPKLWAFSVGRRICPGLNLGIAAALTSMATILATVNVAKTDKTPEVFPTAGGLLDPPLSFELKLVPRSEAAVTMLSASQDL